MPLGAIGMSVFSIDLYFASRGLPASGLLTLSQFLAQAPHWRVLADLLLKTHPVPVVPVAPINLWGSFFPRIERGTAMLKPFRRGVFSPVTLVAGAAVPTEQVTPLGLRDRVAQPGLP